MSALLNTLEKAEPPQAADIFVSLSIDTEILLHSPKTCELLEGITSTQIAATSRLVATGTAVFFFLPTLRNPLEMAKPLQIFVILGKIVAFTEIPVRSIRLLLPSEIDVSPHCGTDVSQQMEVAFAMLASDISISTFLPAL
jgi:hypothetical protein